MYRVTLPSNILYVTSEQLPRFLANVAETKYVNKAGEFLQTTSEHEVVNDSSTAVLLIRQPIKTVSDERDQYFQMWQAERARAEKAEAKVAKTKKRK